MKSILFVFSILTITLFACNALEARKDVDVHIYCQQNKYQAELMLYLNDTFRGNIPFSPEKFTCNQPAPENTVLNINLMPGTYNVSVKDKKDNLVSKGMLILTEDNMELIGQAGGMDARQSEQCMYIEIL